jgi:hypothetical protein
MRRLLLSLAVLVTLSPLSACWESTNVEVSLVGVYTLWVVNSEPAPFLVGESEGHNVEVLEGKIDVKEDQTCEFYHVFRLTNLETSVVTDRTELEPCTWSSNDIAIHIRFRSGGSLSGVRANDSLWFDFIFDQGAMRFGYFRGTPVGLPIPGS